MPIYSPTGFLDITNATLRTSNVEAENLLMTGGNIYVTSELETDATVLNLENVTRKGNVSSNTIEITNATTGIVATGNVQASKFIGSGEYLTGIPPSAITGTLSQWSDGTNGDVYIAGGVGIANAHTLTSNTLQVGGNLYVRDTGSNVLTVDGNVVANYFEGDGSKLSGIVTDLQGVTDNGNTTTNVVQFSNVTTGLVTTANIEVGGDLKIDGLTAGKIPYVAADKFLKDSFITTTGDTTVITSNLDVTGNIFMRGDKFIVHSESKLINDAIVGIANNNTVSTTDKGIIMQNTTGNVAIIHHGTGDGFADQLTFGYTDDPLDTVTVTNDLTKELTVNVLGNVITQNNLSIGGLLKINTISAASSHSLQAVTNLGNVTSNTVQFSNAITSLVASSNIVATGNVSAGHDTNTTSYFGRAAVGYMGQDDQASFAHVDHNDPARYAIKQTAAGPTYINTPAAGHIRFTVNDGNAGAEKMRITSAGNVGVGTTSPSHALTVAAASGDAEVHIQAQGNDGGDAILYFNGASTNQRKCAIISSNVAPNSYCKQDLHFCMETTSDLSDVDITDSKMVITNAGNVGIGTPSPNKKLHIYTTGSESNTQLALESADRYATMQMSDNSGGVLVGNDQGDLRLLTGYDASMAGGSEVMRIKGSGNVGIGTTDPDARLHVEEPSAISATTRLFHTENAFTGGSVGHFEIVEKKTGAGTGWSDFTLRLQRRIDSTEQGYIEFNPTGSSGDYGMAFGTGAVETMRIDALNGNVGIGTTSPNWILEIKDGNDSITHYGPNTTWGGRLSVGAANDKTAANDSATAQCISTNGNLHLDAADTRDIYLCHYRGSNVRFGSTIIHSSDDRLKSEEELITNATDTLLKLSPQKYKKAYTLREDESREPFTESGLMAQDVWYDAPELRHLVHLGSDANPTDTKPEAPVEGDIRQDPDYSSWGTETAALNYDGLIAYLIKSNQELHTRIKALENAS